MKFEIGVDSFIFMNAWFEDRGLFKMGCNSVVNQHCRLDNRGGIVIGSNVSISANLTVLTGDHDIDSHDFRGRQQPVIINDYAFIGTRAMILPGVTIGYGAVVGAGSVVTRNVPDRSFVAGSPARIIRMRESKLEYQINYCRYFM